MRIQEIRPVIGQEVTLRSSINSYHLPEGLEEGSKALVIKAGYGSLTVQQNDREWTISDRCIEHGYLYEVGNRWLPKEHPDVAREAKREEEYARRRSQTPTRATH